MIDGSSVWVVIPAFNEGKAIAQVLEDLAEYPYQIVVVDDGSQDDIAQCALRYPVTLLKHVVNLGQGAALQTGITYALSFSTTRYIVTFDADGQHSASDIPPMLALLQSEQYDVIIGSRFIKGGKAVNIGLTRRLTLWAATLLTRLISGLHITDTHNGLRVFTADAAVKIQITQNRMAHASQILNQIAFLKMRYCEAPVSITYTPYSRAKGQGILNGINILWDIFLGNIR